MLRGQVAIFLSCSEKFKPELAWPVRDALTGEGLCVVILSDAPALPGAPSTPGTPEGAEAKAEPYLDAASAFVKPGGRLVYVTCSVLREENDDRVEGFLAAHAAFVPAAAPVRLDPLSTTTDGFFIAVLERR